VAVTGSLVHAALDSILTELKACHVTAHGAFHLCKDLLQFHGAVLF
jgi:hypothetical protein